MTDLTDRITEVLRQHHPTTRRQQHPSRPGTYWNRPAYPSRPGTYWNRPACTGCDWLGEGHLLQEAHRSHVAQQIAEALGLTEFTCEDKRWWSTALEDRP